MSKVKKKATSDVTTFTLAFAGEDVTLTTNTTVKDTHQSDDQIIQREVPLGYRGYLLDVDDEYYYLGETRNEIFQAVRKDIVTNIAINRPEDLYKDLLETISDDPDGSEIN